MGFSPIFPLYIIQDEAVQLLDCSAHPENEVLQETLDELEGVQTENARLVRERSVHSPFLTREALRRSRDKLADLEVSCPSVCVYVCASQQGQAGRP